jgi:hypothetical protein
MLLLSLTSALDGDEQFYTSAGLLHGKSGRLPLSGFEFQIVELVT